MTELLLPSGSLKSMRYALQYGADAVYIGQPRYSLRVRNNEFGSAEKIEQAIKEVHSHGKKIFIASNIQPHNDKLKYYIRDMRPIIEAAPDALIMSDPGLISMVQDEWGDRVPIHLSVQSNTLNSAAIKFWQKCGITRIILSRELSIKEIIQIRQQCPDIELEVFVHGSLCIAYSGRCLLSGYMNHRDPNQGACTNACRWNYNAEPAEQNVEGNIVPKIHVPSDQTLLISESGRPDEKMPMFEDEHGTYIMNSKDLRAIQHINQLIEIGINSFKIEGRTKSHYYVARVAQLYRQAIDDAKAGKEFNWRLFTDLEHLSNRGYTEGFYRRHTPSDMQNYEFGTSRATEQQFVGEIECYTPEHIQVQVKNRFQVGDTLNLITSQGNTPFTLDRMQTQDNVPTTEAKGSGWIVKIPRPHIPNIPDNHLSMALLTRNL